MKADAFLDQVHGQYSRVLERKIAMGLLAKSPEKVPFKRLYGCLLIVPVKLTTGVLLELIHLVEAAATAALHLAGALFAEDSKRELIKARRAFQVGIPSALIECALRILLAPAFFIKREIDHMRNPVKAEADLRNLWNPQKAIAELEYRMKLARKEGTKRQIQEHIESIKKEIPISLCEFVLLDLQARKESRSKK